MADKALCSISGCSKSAKAHTLCMAHYMRVRKHGSIYGVDVSTIARVLRGDTWKIAS